MPRPTAFAAETPVQAPSDAEPSTLAAMQQAAVQGDAEVQCQLGDRYAEGTGVEKNDAEAARWYRKAAEQGVSTQPKPL